ncbi:MAG: SusC/RagA family TonB-linked outer membrane protein [Bacteroidetes bacterium RIFOXYA12_FULL_40_10]|nr:MAG: SusC/RagA family TonB-linked outer membrane protein [Bacteroidetes bacterium RIFOXYA12_FULL_40_10]
MLLLLPLQSLLFAQGKYSVDVRKESLKSVLTKIQIQGALKFLYSNDDVNPINVESVSIKNADIKDVLNLVLKGSGLTFQIGDDNIIYIKRVKMDPDKKQEKKSIKIKGVVVDSKKLPLPGVSVVLKGTTRGVATDTDGKFALNSDQPENSILLFSFIGMKKREVIYKGETTLLVVLEDDALALNELVVNGIVTRKKESFTGSSTTFNVEDLKMIGNQNILMSLKTLDPSFAIIENNEFGSDPNRLPDIEIRGKSSVIGLTELYGTDPNQPLFILDGFESTLSVISDLSMDRVQSITILKDAAATAIYGSKAANGVVVVETKRPESGRLKINYNGNLSFNFADLTDYNLMNSYEKLVYERLSGYYGTIDAQGNIVNEVNEINYFNRMKEVSRGVDTYWMNEPLRFATTHKHTLFVEGGDQHMRYGIGTSYGKTEGVMKESDREVINENIRLIYRKGKLSFTNTLNIDYSLANRESIPFSKFSRANPYFRKYNEDGVPIMQLDKFQYMDINTLSIITSNFYNPLYDFENNNFDKTSTFGFTNNFELEWSIKEDLRVRSRIGLGKTESKSEIFLSPFNSSFVGSEQLKKGTYSESGTSKLNYDGDVSITYGTLINQSHMVNAVAGLRFSENSAVYSKYDVQGFIDDEFCNPAFAIGYPEGKKSEYSESKRRALSYYMNAGYSYESRYLLDANFRIDGSSVFGTERKFSKTWSVGLGWNLHNEKFFKEIFNVNIFKLRASIGNPGNQNFDDYISMRIYSYNNHNSNPFGVSTIISNLGNKDLEWQKTLDSNIGFDLVTNNNKLRVNFDYFYKKTDPLLVFIGVPSSLGTVSIPKNLGEQLTKGLTLSISYNVIKNKNFSWLANLNLRHLNSKYANIDQSMDIFNKTNRSRNLIRYYNGASPTDLWAVRSAGIDPVTGREVFIDKNGNQTFTHSYDDEVVVGNSSSTVEGVVGSTLRYKGFYATFNFSYRVGGQVFMQTLYNKVENISSGNLHYNQDKRALYARWKKSGDIAKFRAISSTDVTPISSRFVEDNNILSCESVSIGYESNAAWLQKIGATSMTVRAYMNDIFRVSTVKNERGLDYPFARSVSMSLGIRF